VQILANISKRHGAGYVHRDLKPSNFLWLPRQNRWTIIDFGSVARVGETVDMSFSLRYAAPEVVEAVHRGERKIQPEVSQDVWSLGVTAFELLTGVPAFELATDSTQEVLISPHLCDSCDFYEPRLPCELLRLWCLWFRL
jgi:serine/threonine protein kinase